MQEIGRDNYKKEGVCRKNGIIINNGHNLSPAEIKAKRLANLKKYGKPKEMTDKIVIPKLKESQTSEVFDKSINKQLEREKLLNRLTVLRSALAFLQKSESDDSIPSKRRRTRSKKERELRDEDIDIWSDDDIPLVVSTPRRSRRQRGLKPE